MREQSISVEWKEHEMDYIDICDRCNCYFESWGTSNDEDELKFCDNCLEYFENE